MQTNLLVISALGDDRPGIIDELAGLITESGCSIEDSRMAVLGADVAMVMMVEGRWNELAKLEAGLPAAGRRLNLQINAKRTTTAVPSGNRLPYTVEVVSIDHPGIVQHLAGFFSTRGINIREMATTTYTTAHTGTPMFQVHMTVDVAASQHIARLREEFMDLCDQLNLDAIIEPAKL
ncbi:UNVERIFIED_CONTAM: glycine cleavage system protein R [Spiribacter pallidus]|jgi:glycine cleavage system transcriptional repressor|uniref:glycine cleavage system protein R n=1 Tax=Spiribacter pallidus TaxID=1987936 RepID=UPI0034A08ED7